MVLLSVLEKWGKNHCPAKGAVAPVPRREEPAAGLSACCFCGDGVRRKKPWRVSALNLAEDAEGLGWAWVWSGRGKKNCRIGGNL